MRNPSSLFTILMALAVLPPGLAAAQKLDKDEKKWLDDVRPILLAEEEKTYKSLKEKSDRLEFQQIFWARRDPDLATPENEFQAQYLQARADRRPEVPGSRPGGLDTDCGRIFILLGKPDEVQDDAAISPGLLAPQTWTYRDRPGRTFQGGKAVIAFDADCRAPVGFAAQLDRIAAAKVLQPNIDYRTGKDGHLVKLADLLPEGHRGPGPVQAAAAGLRDRAPGLVPQGRRRRHGPARPRARRGGRPRDAESGDAKTVNVSVAASAVAEDGKEAGWTEQTMTAAGGCRRLLRRLVQAGPEAGQVHAEGGRGGRQGRQGLARLVARRGAGPLEGRDRGRRHDREGARRSGSLIVVRGIEEMPAPRSAAPVRGVRARPRPAHPGLRRDRAQGRPGGVLLPGVRPEAEPR